MTGTPKDKAFLAFAYTALEALGKKEKETARKDAQDALREFFKDTGGDRIKVQLSDGTVLATASLDGPKDSMHVTDEDAFFAWTMANQPEALKVDYQFKRSFLERLKPMDDGTFVDPITGSIVDWVKHVPASDAEPKLRLTPFRKDGVTGHDLFWQAFAAGTLPSLNLMPELPATSEGDTTNE